MQSGLYLVRAWHLVRPSVCRERRIEVLTLVVTRASLSHFQARTASMERRGMNVEKMEKICHNCGGKIAG